MEINRWDHSDSSDEDILVSIRKELDELKRNQVRDGIQQSSSKMEYSIFQALTRIAKTCMVISIPAHLAQQPRNNTIVHCPLFRRCCCQCQANIVKKQTLTILFISNLHTSAYQISKKDSDKAKFLFHQQMSLITTAVKLSSLQTSGELILNVQDHLPNTSLTALVTRLVRKELKNINKILLGGVTIYNTIGKLAALSDAIWFWDSVKAHLQEHCLDVHNVYIIGRH